MQNMDQKIHIYIYILYIYVKLQTHINPGFIYMYIRYVPVTYILYIDAYNNIYMYM